MYKTRNMGFYEESASTEAQVIFNVGWVLTDISSAGPITLSRSTVFCLHASGFPSIMTRQPQEQILVISWTPCSTGFYELNVNGLSAGNPGSSGRGSVIRDHHGCFFFRFCEYYGTATSLVVECCVLLVGIKWCIRENFLQVVIDSNSKALVDIIQDRVRVS
ncbi:hypothetical protein ACH5RR_036959 [Cinchona calisaya]|uniref:RNase H type-1 domain-containing protein n=1 Tax=Cinchona calisaya TaxID=153742 RepID=A0ABD2Y9M0_9GENT